MFEQTTIKNCIYRISLTGDKDTITCVLCNETATIEYTLGLKATGKNAKKKAFIKKFEKIHIDKCRKGK